MKDDIAAVVIGRNEGDRLIRCLASLNGQVSQIVYVDSGSTDGSVGAASDAGADVISLDMTQPFTAARARNAGIAALNDHASPAFIQFVDGDCTLQPDWLQDAMGFLNKTPKAAVACGRRRERFPEASIYNAMIDAEWDTPVGQALACGGDALMRTDALCGVGGYNPTMIAGEEPELCVRLRAAGWTIWRLDAEMTLHDAAITRFGQWWNRARRAGFAYAQGAAMHGASPERHKVLETRRAVIWGIILPVLTILGLGLSLWASVLFLIWPTQILRMRHQGHTWLNAVFLVLGKLPEGQGVFGYLWARVTRRNQTLIEYK